MHTVEAWKGALATRCTQDEPVFTLFTATWCAPCKRILPTFVDLSGRFSGRFLKIDIDELSDVALDSGVTAVPTFHVYKGANDRSSETLIAPSASALTEFVSRHASC